MQKSTMLPEGQSDRIAGDRRDDRRYPIELQLKYKLIRRRRVLESGVGRTLDMSSGGIRFESERPLPMGLTVELLIDWPVLLHNVAPMRLVATGKIVRGQGRRYAIQTVQHEFRTQGASGNGDSPRRDLSGVIPSLKTLAVSGWR